MSEAQKVCKYGSSCYDHNLSHRAKYFHPEKYEDNQKRPSSANEARLWCQYGAECYRKDPLHLKTYRHPRGIASAERNNVLIIGYRPPRRWGEHALSEPYLEVDIDGNSKEFRLISDLMNSTIVGHHNKFGTIYGKDPIQFKVTKITRIQNRDLWQKYCVRKKQIMQNNKNKLVDSESSKYLQNIPLLVPLLDPKSNEYCLFHGCDPKYIPILLHEGADPRVANINGMFGGGFYLAENSSKSNQYIPCPGCGLNCIIRKSCCTCSNQEDFDFSILLFRTVLGDVHIAKVHKDEIYKGSDSDHPQRRPPTKENSQELYDSVMGECKKYGGNKLDYREFVIYDSHQAYPEYVIKFKRLAEKTGPQFDVKCTFDDCSTFLTIDMN